MEKLMLGRQSCSKTHHASAKHGKALSLCVLYLIKPLLGLTTSSYDKNDEHFIAICWTSSTVAVFRGFQSVNLANAASKTTTLTHHICATSPSARNLTKGRIHEAIGSQIRYTHCQPQLGRGILTIWSAQVETLLKPKAMLRKEDEAPKDASDSSKSIRIVSM